MLLLQYLVRGRAGRCHFSGQPSAAKTDSGRLEGLQWPRGLASQSPNSTILLVRGRAGRCHLSGQPSAAKTDSGRLEGLQWPRGLASQSPNSTILHQEL